MRKIAVANRKGGVGKTTTAVHLAHGLALTGSRVLLVDTDSQGHCARLLGLSPAKGLAERMEGEEPAACLTSARENLDLLAGGPALVGTQRLIARESFASERLLAKALAPYEGQYAAVILDTAPGAGELAVNVMFYASEMIVPVSMEVLAVDGLLHFEEDLVKVREFTPIAIRAILPTFLDGRVRKSEQIMEILTQRFGPLVVPPIHYSVALSEAPGWGQTVYEYRPKDRAALDYGALLGVL